LFEKHCSSGEWKAGARKSHGTKHFTFIDLPFSIGNSSTENVISKIGLRATKSSNESDPS